MIHDAKQMIDELLSAGNRECVAYGVDTREDINRIVFPLLVSEARRRGITVTLSYDRITNEKGGYLFLFAWRDPNWEGSIRGRQIIAGNIPKQYMRRY